MNNMRFKVGDKVRIREDLVPGVFYGNCSFSKEMCVYKNKEATIKKNYNEDIWTVCELDIDDGAYCWSDVMLEPVKPLFSLSNIIIDDITNITLSSCSDDISDISVIIPNKVVEITFTDKHKEKMICHKDDIFDLRTCCFIAIAKRKYKATHTQEGIEWKAFKLTHLKKYNKIVDKALKDYENKQKAEAAKKIEEIKKQERIERKRAKRLAYKQRRAERKAKEEKERQIEIQKEAYIQALKAVAVKDGSDSVVKNNNNNKDYSATYNNWKDAKFNSEI